MTEAASAALEEVARLLGPGARRDHPLGPLTTYRVGGRAAVFYVAADRAGLERAAAAVTATGVEVVVVGKGSNLLVADAGFAGLAVSLGEAFTAIDIEGTVVRAGGAVALPVLARRTAAAALTGLEWAVGVPGSVGGAVRMNAGGHGSDVAATLRAWDFVDLASGASGPSDAAALALGYRRSAVAPTQVVTWAEFGLRPGDRSASEAEIAEIVRWRREHQPGGQNCGSVFTNPAGDSAGRLVDAAGLRGLRSGTARVSEKHANFIQADEDGSADDVLALIRHIQTRVHDTFGVMLHPEVKLVGFTEPGLADAPA